ncbi:MAG: hypothetical protein JST00_12010 [Deltaproteobacteria bacterium]|nr:hypothetical protein [Deltaproteobacteria bacterium]
MNTLDSKRPSGASAVVITCGLLLATLTFGCAAAPAEPSPVPAPTGEVSEKLAIADGVPGYKHMAARSRFAIGKAPVQRSEHGLEKLVGTDGVISTRPRTGLVVAMPNANAPSRRKPPIPGADAHNAAVRAYFVAAGLPQDQILGVETYPAMSAGGPGDKLDVTQGTLDHYYSVVTRQVHGVKVLDSFAWARINADGEVVSESVYWPPLPNSVAADAVAFRAKLDNPTARAALVAKLANVIESPDEGTLFIRHTPGEWDGPFAAAASYDLVKEKRIVHVRADGGELELPHENARVTTPSSPRKSVR